MSNLTKVQTEFLKIAESFMHGKAYELPDDFNELSELYKLSSIHKMLPVVYEKIRNDDIWKSDEWKSLKLFWRRNVIKEVALQTQRTEGFLEIYEKLKSAGIKPIVVKGLICRNMYLNPEYRTSGDEDIVIRKGFLKKADRIFNESGYIGKEVGDDKFEQQTISYINMRNGVYVEVQPTLFNEEFATLQMLNDEFSDMFSTCIVEKIQDNDIYTLEPTKHYIYLIYHAFKHFLTGGFGIRQVCDIVKMAELYSDDINWKYVAERLREVHLDGFYKGLEQIAVHHLEYHGQRLYEEKIDYVPLLQDLFDAGIFGKSSEERKRSATVTFMAVEKARKSEKKQGDDFLFPNVTYMKKSVPWLKKYPWLLPIGYIVRILRYFTRSMLRKGNKKNSLKIGAERVELLRKYGIIK